MPPFLLRILIAVGLFLGAGCILFLLWLVIPAPTILYPLPHQIPKYPGGVSFRFAMVHDVLHDRYPRHGDAYYRERNRRVLTAIERSKDADGLPAAEQFGLIDDLGVGLDSLGEFDEAVRWLQLKLKAEEKLGRAGKDLYITYANLGTFIIHASAAKSMQGDKPAQGRVREGLRYLYKAIDVNSEAHFGREIWQVVTVEFMLRVADDRELLLQHDLIGNRLDKSLPRAHLGRLHPHDALGAGSALNMHLERRDLWVKAVKEHLDNPKPLDRAGDVREHITHVSRLAWSKELEDRASINGRWPHLVSFDEPCLGIIGLWRLGGGANPHFALALGETMGQVGQRRLAWAGFQRAIREAERFSADDNIRQKLIEHCKKRQAELGFDESESIDLHRHFEAELQFGQDYQRAFQKYEEQHIAAGKDLDDPHFYDAFHTKHGNIATPIGDADFLAVEEWRPNTSSVVVLAVGYGVFVSARLLLAWQRRRQRNGNVA